MKKLLITTAIVAALTASSQSALYLQLIADDLKLTQGAEVTSWTDSASGNVFTNTDSKSTTTTAASYETNYNGSGHAAVLFKKNAFLKSILVGSTPDTATMTVFIVGQFTADTTNAEDYLVSAQHKNIDAGANRLRLAITSSNKWRTRVGTGVNIDDGTSDWVPHVFSIVSGQGLNKVKMDIDGSAVLSSATALSGSKKTTTPAANLHWLNLGGLDNAEADKGGARDFATGYIAEIRIYDTAMTDLEIAAINAELSAKYAAGLEPSSAALLGIGGVTLILHHKK